MLPPSHWMRFLAIGAKVCGDLFSLLCGSPVGVVSGRPLAASDALRLVKRGIVKCRELESRLDAETAIFVRRSYVAPEVLKELPFRNYDYKYVSTTRV